MDSEEKPLSFKERKARFQNLMHNPQGDSPSSKPATTAPSSQTPEVAKPSPISEQPPSTPQNPQQGEVEDSIVKPSVAREMWQQNMTNVQRESPQKRVESPSTKTTQPKSPQPVDPVPLSVPETGAKKASEKEVVMSQNAIKQMLEQKMTNSSQPSYPTQQKSFVPKLERVNTPEEAPPATQNTQMGSVKGNAQKLNQFFETQRESQKNATEEEAKRSEEVGKEEPKPRHVSPERKEVVSQGNTQNIGGATTFYVPAEINESAPQVVAAELRGSSIVAGQEQSLTGRLKKKRRTRQTFSSEQD